MKANTPSLIIYILAAVAALIFSLMDHNLLSIYSKGIVASSAFIYYFITNNYQIKITKVIIFILSFIGEIIVLLESKNAIVIMIFCFLSVYSILLKNIINDFLKLKIDKNDFTNILVSTILIILLIVMVLSLKLEKVDFSFSIFVVYAIVLALLSVLSIISYIKQNTPVFLNLVLMACCFLISDIFYVLNYFYLSLSALHTTAVLTQVLSYYFMVRYFLERDKLTSIKQ